MRFPRSSGILLHPTSLPGRYGIGDLGAEARRFADFLHAAGQSIWQVLPVNPTGYGDSPYQSFSAFAGNPLLISLDELRERGYLTDEALATPPSFPDDTVAFERVIPYRLGLLRKAAQSFFSSASADERDLYRRICASNWFSLDQSALFIAAKEQHNLVTWTDWDSALARREPQAVESWRERLLEQIDAQRYCHFEFNCQWCAL